MALALDRKAFIDILTEGKADVGGAMLPPPEGAVGHAGRRCCAKLPGYGPDVEKNRAEARKIMEKLGYGAGQAADDQGLDAQHRRPIATRR